MSAQEQRYIIEGLTVGATANNQIADVMATKTAKMLDEALQENFEVILQAKLSHAVNETLSLHADRTKKLAQSFLSQSKTRMATTMIDTQHNNRLAAIRSFAVDDLEAFDTDLKPEVSRLADASGTITIEADATSPIGF
jgi:hypothetical protein